MSTSKSRRILITPNVASPYDQRMVQGLADGFNRIGHFAGAMPTPLSAVELYQACQSLSIDTVIQINRTRDLAVPLPKIVRHVAWFQDVFPETLSGFAERFRGDDILYALGDAAVLGLVTPIPCRVGSLFTGVDKATLNFSRRGLVQDIDMSLCGALPPPVALTPSLRTDLLWYIDKLIGGVPCLGRSKGIWAVRRLLFNKYVPVDYVPYAALLAIAQVVEGFYRPLRGELDIHMLADAMGELSKTFSDVPMEPPGKAIVEEPDTLSRLLKPYAARFNGRGDFKARVFRFLAKEGTYFASDGLSPLARATSYFAQSYPRIMDRRLLIQLAAGVTDSLELYGSGLALHDFTRPYYKGVIESIGELLSVYCRSKINLSNNTHGLGLHSRTLECMAVGGFIFMHDSPHDTKAGGMLTEFEPDVHYGRYTVESFHEDATRWLKDSEGRIRVGMQAVECIRQRHCWHHRALQIIEDLDR
ncbi:MAG: glycosyltransferase family 1 protein [Nitrospira sp.]|nr:glycosyltransferase family 1 protein [Nitrospira sp.]